MSETTLIDMEALKAIHTPFMIWDQCDHNHEREDRKAGVFDIEDVGLTCVFIFSICMNCCMDCGDQTEMCCSSHQHGKDVPICKTMELVARTSEEPLTRYQQTWTPDFKRGFVYGRATAPDVESKHCTLCGHQNHKEKRCSGDPLDVSTSGIGGNLPQESSGCVCGNPEFAL